MRRKLNYLRHLASLSPSAKSLLPSAEIYYLSGAESWCRLQRVGAQSFSLDPFLAPVITHVSARTRTFYYICISRADVAVASKHN